MLELIAKYKDKGYDVEISPIYSRGIVIKMNSDSVMSEVQVSSYTTTDEITALAEANLIDNWFACELQQLRMRLRLLTVEPESHELVNEDDLRNMCIDASSCFTTVTFLYEDDDNYHVSFRNGEDIVLQVPVRKELAIYEVRDMIENNAKYMKLLWKYERGVV